MTYKSSHDDEVQNYAGKLRFEITFKLKLAAKSTKTVSNKAVACKYMCMVLTNAEAGSGGLGVGLEINLSRKKPFLAGGRKPMPNCGYISMQKLLPPDKYCPR